VGFRTTFALGGIFYAVSFVLCWVFVKEDFQRPPADETRPSYVENLRLVLRAPAMLLLITVMFLVSSAATFVRPLLPFVVESFTDVNVAVKSGLVFAAVALTSAVAAVVAGRYADRVGYRNVLVVATLGAGIAYIPVAGADNLIPLLFLMALVGIFSGAMIPVVNALIGRNAPEGKHGSAFGLVGSAQALSFAVAPLLGGITASRLGINAGFVIIGCMLIVVSALVWLTVREPKRIDDDDVVAAPETAPSLR
jgi:MFS family permease